MNGIIHYLIQSPVNRSEVIYPTDLDTELYYGYGGFFVVGIEYAKPAESYVFHAILGEQRITAKMVRFPNSSSFYYVEIAKAGAFLFYTRKLTIKLKYGGRDVNMRDHLALHRVWPCSPKLLESACHNHGFYFTGYSPH